MPTNMRAIFNLKPMRVVKRADRQMRCAEVLFGNHQSDMRSDDLMLANDKMTYAKELRLGVEKKSWKAKLEQAKLYSKGAQLALDMVEDVVENIRKLVTYEDSEVPLGSIVGA